MRKNMAKVIEAFKSGRAAIGDTKRTCSTDGNTIWSYAMPIAWRNPDGTIGVVAYEKAPSQTTRTQVRACMVALKP